MSTDGLRVFISELGGGEGWRGEAARNDTVSTFSKRHLTSTYVIDGPTRRIRSRRAIFPLDVSDVTSIVAYEREENSSFKFYVYSSLRRYYNVYTYICTSTTYVCTFSLVYDRYLLAL